MDVNAILAGPAVASNGAGSIVDTKEGETRADVEARIEEAKKNAKDLQGLTRKKAPKVEDSHTEMSSNGKRKAEDESEGESKKVKLDE